VLKSEEEIKKRCHNLRTSGLRYFKKYSSGDGELNWAYWSDMTFPCRSELSPGNTHGAVCRKDLSQRLVASCVPALTVLAAQN
jgi:hypothetical protein